MALSLRESRGKGWNAERVLDHCHDVVCSCRRAREYLRAAVPARLDHEW